MTTVIQSIPETDDGWPLGEPRPSVFLLQSGKERP